MSKRPVEHDGHILRRAALAALLALAGCAEPARVVLYEERHGSAETRPAAPRAVPVVKSAAEPAGPAATHRVRSGDTVYTIALRHQVPIRGVIERNGLQAPYLLRSGQVLRLPEPRRHTVQPGDTIYGISRRYDVAISRLVQLNGLTPPYTIVVGQTLRLPGSIAPSDGGTAVDFRREVARRAAPPDIREERPRPGAKPPAAPRRAAAVPAAVPKPPPLAGRKFLLPVRGRVLSRFGPTGKGLRNDGVNIAALRGTPVRAAENGIVVYSGNALLGFGNMVLLRHANGYMTAYAHNDSVSVARGDTVRRGQVIATVGSTGNVAAPQLHFEIRKGKRAVDPAKYLPALAAAT